MWRDVLNMRFPPRPPSPPSGPPRGVMDSRRKLTEPAPPCPDDIVILTSSTNFIGTTDAQALVVKTSNTEQMRVLASGNVGIGTQTPQSKLDIEGGAVIGATYSGSNAAPTNGLLVEGNVERQGKVET